MEFLLFLCAALSALTGAFTGTRVPGRDVQIERVSTRASLVAPIAARAVAAVVQAQRTPAPNMLRSGVAPRTFLFSNGISVRGERRRE
jgi:hypothetical protein